MFSFHLSLLLTVFLRKNNLLLFGQEGAALWVSSLHQLLFTRLDLEWSFQKDQNQLWLRKKVLDLGPDVIETIAIFVWLVFK